MSTHTHTNIGIIEIVKRTCEETHLEWRIPHFSTILTKDNDLRTYYDSPDFIVCDVPWCMRLYPKVDSLFEFIRLYIYTSWERKYSLEYNLGLKRLDGSVEQIVIGILEGNSTRSSVGNLIKLSELMQRKSELAPQNALTVVCRLRREVSHSTEPSAKIIPLKLIKLHTLSENIHGLFTNQEFCDITLEVQNKEFRVHKAIIAARSPVFAAMFKHETSEKQTGVINIPDCDPDAFLEFLRFLYCGKVENISSQSIIHLFKIADKYDVNELSCFCIDCMRHDMKMENFFDVIALAEEYDHEKLHNAVQDFFSWNRKAIFETAEWENLIKTNFNFANRLLIEMSSNVEIVRKEPRFDTSTGLYRI